MADTIRGNFSDQTCSDCGEKGCVFKHWGSLVPPGVIGYFCAFCMNVRAKAEGPPSSLGVKPPGIPDDLSDKEVIKVTTQSGSVYELRLMVSEKNEWLVSCEARDLLLDVCRVMSLVEGQNMALKFRKKEDINLFLTSPVVKIEVIS